MIRYAQPFELFGGKWLMRATLPFNTTPQPDGGHETGLGDFNLLAALTIDAGKPTRSVDIGPLLTIPTGGSGVGSEKWSTGLAAVLFASSSPRFQYGSSPPWPSASQATGAASSSIWARAAVPVLSTGKGLLERKQSKAIVGFDCLRSMRPRPCCSRAQTASQNSRRRSAGA